MRIIDAKNAAAYLQEQGRVGPDEKIVVHELSGGVSNVVLHVARNGTKPNFVLKQVRPQLRVADPWYSSIERIWREVEVLQVCERALGPIATDQGVPVPCVASIPQVLFCDRDNYLYAMSAAPPHRVWKEQLLRGNAEPTIAASCGATMGQLHAATWNDPDVASRLRDTLFFDQLRVDPYYRHMIRQQPELASCLEPLIQSLVDHPRCLVHGDFSPKNLLIHDDGMTLIDFEVGHFGDPAFDIGFFLSHLILKALNAGRRWWDYVLLTFAFWRSYESALRDVIGVAEYDSLVGRGILNFAGCALARVDGKSKVDYLDDLARNSVRRFARTLLETPRSTWSEVIALLLPFAGEGHA